MEPNLRYKKKFFDKKIHQNRKLKNHLIEKILEHKEENFPWVEEELRNLEYCDLFEIAVAAVNKRIQVLAEVGRDWSYGADGKVAVVRTSNYGRNYSALITGCKGKKYILSVVYEAHLDKFYYFAFPAKIKQHTIPFIRESRLPDTKNYMWEYQRESFEDMAHRAHTWMACK